MDESRFAPDRPFFTYYLSAECCCSSYAGVRCIDNGWMDKKIQLNEPIKCPAGVNCKYTYVPLISVFRCRCITHSTTLFASHQNEICEWYFMTRIKMVIMRLIVVLDLRITSLIPCHCSAIFCAGGRCWLIFMVWLAELDTPWMLLIGLLHWAGNQ